ncbi:MAG TPA: hypothetical protein VLE44_02870 [Candidatus Saccharimonadales bacterium]|nr:hypothetical protein [Candidatus Saccharimonadales bacterium]
MNFKNLLFFFLTVLVFTQGLILLHESKFEKGEFDRICNSIYSEKVWIDTCYLPYNSEIKTFELVRNVLVAGTVLSTLGLLTQRRFNV